MMRTDARRARSLPRHEGQERGATKDNRIHACQFGDAYRLPRWWQAPAEAEVRLSRHAKRQTDPQSAAPASRSAWFLLAMDKA